MQKNRKYTETQLMAEAPVSRAVASMAIPCVISSLVTVIYNLADTFFIGQTNDALQVAAVSLTNPIFVLMMAFSSMLGIGGSALASRAFGEGREDKAKNTSAFVLYASLIVGIIFLAVLLLFPQPILHLFGANSETYDFANGYTRFIALGAPFIIISPTISNVVRAEGASKEAMTGVLIGTVANIILDPIMITGLHMGVAGAAIATSLGNVLACLYFLYYFMRKNTRLSLSPRYFTLEKSVGFVICRDGFPTAIFSILQSISLIILNNLLVQYGNDPVAAIGIVFKLSMLMAFLQMGIANGVMPLLGYNFASGDHNRFVKIQRFSKICCIITGVVTTLVMFLFREPIIQAFLDDPSVVSYGVMMLTFYVLSGPVLGILFVNMNSMQAIGSSLPATILSIMRQGALYLPVLFIFGHFLGLNGLVAAQSITDWVVVILSIILWKQIRHRKISE